jgi:hypothetical protein
MADGITVQVRGLREIKASLVQLPDKLAKKVIVKSMRPGVTIIKKKIEQAAPVRTGVLRKGFVIRASKINKKPPIIGAFLTLRRIKKDKGAKRGKRKRDPNDPFYGKFVEYGYFLGKKTRVVVKTRKTGKKKGKLYKRRVGTIHVPGQLFAHHAFLSVQEAATVAIVDAFERNIPEVLRELNL